MMEIKIKSVTFKPTTTGKDKWGVETEQGNFSVWDGVIAEALSKSIGMNVNVQIREAAPGSNYLPTITKLGGEQSGEVNYSGQHTTPTSNLSTPSLGTNTRERSIVAQVCLKGAVELAKDFLSKEVISGDILGEFLCMATNELAGAYKVAFDKLE